MNLVGTLGKMLLSGALSKGGAGNVLGSLLGGAAQQGGAGAGGLGELLGSLSGGKSGGAGGLGELLGGLSGGQSGGGGGMADLLSKMQQGGGTANSGGGLLGSLLGGATSNGGGLGDLLGSALGQQLPTAAAKPVPAPSVAQSDHAALLIRAMINAAKSDGSVDQQEQEKIVGRLGDIGEQEAAFIRSEMSAPLNLPEFIKSVPRGMEQQVYMLSLMSINLDSKAEADYLDKLAQGLNITQQISNQLHQEVGAPLLYA